MNITTDVGILHKTKTLRAAVIGNPNTGKTTLFNTLTGLNQKVGNYPGVTVERKTGRFSLLDKTITLIDLPGAYSLASRSPDEMLVADVLLGQQPGEEPIDLIVAVVDASNIHRNFYLVSQILELGLPVAIALNMIDIAKSKGIQIDAEGLERRLGVPVVPIVARHKTGIDDLQQAIVDVINELDNKPKTTPKFPDAIHLSISQLTQWVQNNAPKNIRDIPEQELFRALIDREGYAEQRLEALLGPSFIEALQRERNSGPEMLPLSSIEVKARYEWIDSVLGSHVKKPAEAVSTTSDRIDRILTHRIYGSVIFFFIMALVFQSIYSWAAPIMDFIDAGFGSLSEIAAQTIPEGALQSLVVDGVIAGVGGVLIFLPQICILFLFIAILEDCGYLPRAAYLMDRLLSFCGLSGKSFIPMLSSFACAIPGVMATRTIEDRNDRLTTIMVAPLMSCSARLPVYLIFIAAFVPNRTIFGSWLNLQGLVLFGMYLLGIVVAIPIAWIINRWLSKGKEASFLLELPTYKWPTLRNVSLYVFDRAKAFIVRAGTIIFFITIVIWAMAYFPRPASIHDKYEQLRAQAASEEQIADYDNQENGEYIRQSILGRMGRTIEPVVKPLGWDWRIGMATIASFPAREIVVAVLGTIFNLGDIDDESQALRDTLRSATWEDGTPLFNLAVALSIMVYFALCCQCGATLATIKRESNSYAWTAASFVYMTLLAYAASFVTYQAGCFMGWG